MSATLSMPGEPSAITTPARGRTRARNVLYVANSSKIGGANRSLIDLISRLDRSRYRSHLVMATDGPMSEWARTAAIPYHIVAGDDWSGRRDLVRRAVRLLALLAARRIDIVHAMAPTCYRAAGVAARVTGALRVVHLGYPPEPGELERSFVSGPDAVLGCYHQQAMEAAPEVARLAPRCRVIGVPNGIDLERFSPRPSAAAAVRASFGVENRPLVLIVGHLSEVKGYPTFLRAARTIANAVPDCAFAALGGETVSPGYGKVLHDMAVGLGLANRVRFLGWRPDVADVLQAADVVTLPSRAEGLPLAVLEAMACARPVVATPVGGVPDAVVNEETGLLVPPDDPRRLAAAILRLLRDRETAARMGAAGRRRVESSFSLESFASGVEAVYRDLLTPAPRLATA
ncbi:MAG TPA: glycosyltransferase family 4 protein [Vicinamibacterales bacterium]|jgi:glycosyltransferase involved in cell wall biosynthesis|nr:glycosyltransferase family 4 protein [Vicinamibacterales bacterium]